MRTDYKRCFTVLVLVLSVALAPLLAEANSTPVRMKRDPVFEITPLLDTPLVVDKELLTFDVGPSPSNALVTADYQIANPSTQTLTIPMIFPAISEIEPLFRPQITLNGEELPYELFLVGSASVEDYFQSPQAFAEQVDIDSILLALNEPQYEPLSFKPTDKATLYEVTLGGQLNRQSTISFEFDPTTTKVLSTSHQGYQGKSTQNGLEVTFSRSVGPRSFVEPMTILIIGEDSLKGLTVSSGDFLEKKEVTLEDFLKDGLLLGGAVRQHLDRRNIDNLYSGVLQELDRSWSLSDPFEAVRAVDDVFNLVFYRNNLSVFLFTVTVPPESINNLIVTYPVKATIDRSASANYVNTFAYILNPARNFADFGTLDIEISLNEHSPYILESSIPLETDGTGRYFASLQGLPDVDLVFSTYKYPKITSVDTLRARISPFSYPLVVLLVVIVFMLLFAAVVYVLSKLFRSSQSS